MGNLPCSLTAIGMYIAIRLAVFYICAFSISLVLALYCPTFKQLRRYFHISVWACIGIGIIPLVQKKSVAGDLYLGFCTTSLNSRENLLSLNIIPLAVCVFIFFVCLAMASVKLFRQNKELA